MTTMTTTNHTALRWLARDEWASRFDAFSKHFLRDDAPEVATVEVDDGARGPQRAVAGARVLGITYDRHGNVLDVALEGVDHLVLRPVTIHVREDADGFVEEIRVLREDGLRETITLERPAAPAGVRRRPVSRAMSESIMTPHPDTAVHTDVVSLAQLAPGEDTVIEAIGAAARGRAAALALHEGQVVGCRARGSSGLGIHVAGHPDTIVPDDMAEAILVRRGADAAALAVS